MSDRARFVFSEDLREYDHGPQHPLRPVRVLLTVDLIASLGLLERANVERAPARVASDEELMLVHTEPYLDAVKRSGEASRADLVRYGFGPGDNPIFPNMHRAGARVAGATLVAAEAVVRDGFDHAFNPAGGLHHAMPDRASGFCVYDDPAVAIAWMLEQGVERVAYVDVDVHHGDGPQAIFYEDPRVLTISLHESGRYLFPGTGFASERGAGPGEGTAVNVPLPPTTGDDAWLEAFRAVVPPLVRRFAPQVLVSQLGCDTHHTDPLAHLGLTTRAYGETARALHDLAHEACDGRWIATGGGGYRWASVVPRAWTIAFAEMVGAELPDEIPADWLRRAEEAGEGRVPATFSEAAPERADPPIDGILEEVLRGRG